VRKVDDRSEGSAAATEVKLRRHSIFRRPKWLDLLCWPARVSKNDQLTVESSCGISGFFSFFFHGFAETLIRNRMNGD
jgi:hypothetical protein